MLVPLPCTVNPPGPLYGWVFTLGRGALGGGLGGLGCLGGFGSLGVGSGGDSSIMFPLSSTGGGGVTGDSVGAGGWGGLGGGGSFLSGAGGSAVGGSGAGGSVVGGSGAGGSGAGGSRGVSGVRSTTLRVTMGEFVIGSSVGLPVGFLVGLGVGEIRPVSTLRLVGISVVLMPLR